MPHQVSHAGVHQFACGICKKCCAFAWRTPRKWSAQMSASYSERSAVVSWPSLHFSASASTRACTRGLAGWSKAGVEGNHYVVRITDPGTGARWYKFVLRKKKK